MLRPGVLDGDDGGLANDTAGLDMGTGQAKIDCLLWLQLCHLNLKSSPDGVDCDWNCAVCTDGAVYVRIEFAQGEAFFSFSSLKEV